MKAGDLRPGMAVSMDGRLCVVVKVEHRTPGNLRAFVQAKFKEVISAQHTEKRLNPAESVEATTLDRRGCEFLYQDGTGYIFMDSQSFDQFTLDEDTVGDAAGYLPPTPTATSSYTMSAPSCSNCPPQWTSSSPSASPGSRGRPRRTSSRRR